MGASTGRDGIGGASVLASAELGEGDEAKRPTVQIGDPFEESKVLECCLELLAKGLLVSLQDLGAAGLTSSAGEMASAGGVGIDLDVAKVPLREADMEPFEIMVSESQERMLAVVEPARVAEVLAICEKWQTGSAEIGVVTDSGQVRILRGGEVVGEMPVEALVDGCPLYDLEPAEPEGWIYGNRATLAAGASRRGRAAGAARRAQRRLQALGLRAVRLGRRLAHRAPARVGRRRGPAAARGRQRDRRLDRRQRPPRRLRPLRRHGRGGARVRPEPRLRRRRAARPDQLPQLRQPREAGAPPGSSTARSAASPTPARRSACRSSAATSPSTTRGPTARSTRPRWSAWSASCPTRRRSPAAPSSRAGDAIALLGPFSPTLAGSELTKQRGELGHGAAAARRRRGRRGLRDRPRRGPRRHARLAPTTSATAASPAPWPSRDRRRARLPGRPAAAARARLLPRGGALRRGQRRLPAQRRARRAGGARRDRPRRGRRHRRSRSPPATAASSSASAPPRPPGARWRSASKRSPSWPRSGPQLAAEVSASHAPPAVRA